MAKQLGFLLNQKYCIGCQACQTACQVKNNSDIGISLRVADSFEVKPEGVYITTVSVNSNPHSKPLISMR